MTRTTWAWVTPGAFLAATLLAGCGGGGGGGSSSPPPSPPPVTTPGAVALTATPGHGFVALNWTQPNMASGTTYTIQRELGNGSGGAANGASFQNLPSASGGSAVSVSGTAYQDPTYAAPVSNGSQTITFPSVGAQYLYRVTASTAQVSNIATATPNGPDIGYNLNNDNSTSAAPTPFTANGSHVYYTYTVPASNPTHPVITMHFVFDYVVTTTADVDHLTLDVAGDTSSTSGAVIYSHAQIASGLTINSGNNHEIDFTSAGLGLSIPVASPYSLVLLNAYVAPTDSAASSSDVPFQFCYRLPGVGVSTDNTEPGLTYGANFTFTLQDQSSGT